MLLLLACKSYEQETKIVYVDRPVEVIREIEIEVPVEVPVEVLVEIIKEIEKLVVVEVPITKEVPTRLGDWESLEELQAFLAGDPTDSRIILVANSSGIVKLHGQCEDRAIQLMDGAQEVGKRLFLVPLHPSEYLKWYGSYPGSNIYHAVCGALVGDNDFYYIEPSTDRCILAIYLD